MKFRFYERKGPFIEFKEEIECTEKEAWFKVLHEDVVMELVEE